MSNYSLFLVIAQFILITLLLALCDIIIFNWFFIVLQSLGIFIAIWGVFTIQIGNFNIQPEVKSETLVTTGPFKYVRNPMYLGILLFFLPVSLFKEDFVGLFLYIMLIIVFIFKINREERLLLDRFGITYQEYKKTSNRLIPFIF